MSKINIRKHNEKWCRRQKGLVQEGDFNGKNMRNVNIDLKLNGC